MRLFHFCFPLIVNLCRVIAHNCLLTLCLLVLACCVVVQFKPANASGGHRMSSMCLSCIAFSSCSWDSNILVEWSLYESMSISMESPSPSELSAFTLENGIMACYIIARWCDSLSLGLFSWRTCRSKWMLFNGVTSKFRVPFVVRCFKVPEYTQRV